MKGRRMNEVILTYDLRLVQAEVDISGMMPLPPRVLASGETDAGAKRAKWNASN
jgi:hypothetical protein